MDCVRVVSLATSSLLAMVRTNSIRAVSGGSGQTRCASLTAGAVAQPLRRAIAPQTDRPNRALFKRLVFGVSLQNRANIIFSHSVLLVQMQSEVFDIDSTNSETVDETYCLHFGYIL